MAIPADVFKNSIICFISCRPLCDLHILSFRIKTGSDPSYKVVSPPLWICERECVAFDSILSRIGRARRKLSSVQSVRDRIFNRFPCSSEFLVLSRSLRYGHSHRRLIKPCSDPAVELISNSRRIIQCECFCQACERFRIALSFRKASACKIDAESILSKLPLSSECIVLHNIFYLRILLKTAVSVFPARELIILFRLESVLFYLVALFIDDPDVLVVHIAGSVISRRVFDLPVAYEQGFSVLVNYRTRII